MTYTSTDLSGNSEGHFPVNWNHAHLPPGQISRSKQGLTCRRDSLLLMPLLFSLLSFPVAAQEIGTLGETEQVTSASAPRSGLGDDVLEQVETQLATFLGPWQQS